MVEDWNLSVWRNENKDLAFSLWVRVYQHGTSCLGHLCPLFLAKALQICQIARASPVSSRLQVSLQIVNGIQEFRSGLWLNHSKALIFFWWSCSFVDLELCIGLLLCWKVNSLFLFSFIAEIWTDWYMELFIIPSTLTKASVPAAEKHHASKCHVKVMSVLCQV